MSGFRSLEIYRRSYKAARSVYAMTERFPKEELYGMTNQLRRAALSIPMNIAEGYAKRDSQNEFRRFLMMGIGSANELQVLIDFAKDVGYIDANIHKTAAQEYEEIGKMLNKFIQSVNKHI